MPIKIRFHKGNKLRYMQDFAVWEGIPHHVEFDVEILPDRDGDEPNSRVKLRAPGYGYPYPNYGNGALYISRATVNAARHSVKYEGQLDDEEPPFDGPPWP